MSKVKIYKFKVWDNDAGENKIAPRMATREFVAKARGEVMEGTEREIDSSLLDENMQAPINIQPRN
jgi:hypothetical protein